MTDTSAQALTNWISSEEAMELERQYGAHNYAPQPAVLAEGKGIDVWDPEGRHYYDCLAAYSALNQGHCHPRIIEVLKAQAEQLTLTSRAFYSNWLGRAEQYLAQTFHFDKVLFMNSGVEAVETALKLTRKWAYQVKEIPADQAKVLVVDENFHGRTINVISFSTEQESRQEFGPFNPGYEVIPYNDTEALEKAVQDPHVAGFLVEPVQGEAGAVVPDDGYLKTAKAICERHNVLFLADEIQSGIGRTGAMLACDHEDVKPDILILGKALSAGTMPVSAVLADDEVMLTMQPGEHGSTFGGNPLGARIAIEAVQTIIDEDLPANAANMGALFRERLRQIHHPWIQQVRGKGLLNALVMDPEKATLTAKQVCKHLVKHGLLAKQTQGNVIRFTPPLIITEEQVHACCDIIEETFHALSS